MPAHQTRAMSMLGHIVAVESDDDMGRHWTTFDATTRAGSIAAAEHIETLADASELSDIDCATTCPCALPITGCESCDAYGTVCRECRDDYDTAVTTVVRGRIGDDLDAALAAHVERHRAYAKAPA